MPLCKCHSTYAGPSPHVLTSAQQTRTLKETTSTCLHGWHSRHTFYITKIRHICIGGINRKDKAVQWQHKAGHTYAQHTAAQKGYFAEPSSWKTSATLSATQHAGTDADCWNGSKKKAHEGNCNTSAACHHTANSGSFGQHSRQNTLSIFLVGLIQPHAKDTLPSASLSSAPPPSGQQNTDDGITDKT